MPSANCQATENKPLKYTELQSIHKKNSNSWHFIYNDVCYLAKKTRTQIKQLLKNGYGVRFRQFCAFILKATLIEFRPRSGCFSPPWRSSPSVCRRAPGNAAVWLETARRPSFHHGNNVVVVVDDAINILILILCVCVCEWCVSGRPRTPKGALFLQRPALWCTLLSSLYGDLIELYNVVYSEIIFLQDVVFPQCFICIRPISRASHTLPWLWIQVTVMMICQLLF